MVRASLLPNRLKEGDLARVISFGLSLKGASPYQREICNETLARIGLCVSFGRHVEESDEFDTSSVSSRLEDLNDALGDPKVKLILPGLGGMNGAQILRYMDWQAIRKTKKIFCGFSDMATLVNAIYAKTGLVTYYGPFYGTFGMKKGFEYMLDAFKKCLFTSEAYVVKPAPYWSDDSWWVEQDNRTFYRNEGPIILNRGKAQGILIGGHLTSFATLFGTEFCPNLSGSILLIEENSEINARSFERLLQALIHQKNFQKIRGIIIGRFTLATKITNDVLQKIIGNYPELREIPIIANMDFGHTYPQFTIPIGGTARIDTTSDIPTFHILRH